MQVTELKKDGLDFHIRVVIPSTTITDEINKEFADLAKKAKMPGFRAGKIPLNIIKQKYGASVRSDIIRHKINQTIHDLIEKDKLNLAIDPTIIDSITEEDKNLEFTVKFELMPEIALPNFKEISIERPTLEVKDQDIDQQLSELVQSAKVYAQETDKPAAIGDQVTISAVGYIDGVAFDGGKLENHKLVLGSKAFISGFEDQLIGSKAGDQVAVNVTFPEDYHSAGLAAKPAMFDVKVMAIHTAATPEINEDFAKKFSCDTVEKLRDKIADDLKARMKEQIHTILKMRLFNKLEHILNFAAPASLVDREYQFLKTKSAYNTTEDAITDTEDAKLEEYYQKLALRRVRIGLLLAEYARIKDLKINQDDIRKAILQQIRQFPNQAKEVMEYYQKNRQAVEALHGPILEEKAVQHIFEHELSMIEKAYFLEELESLLDQENDNDIA
ncbi:Trigger factor [Candidatus Trichorickettsia mobilis]|uniref:Trigger factor n=1 Tax=Candidatus Trichorickettsia mobilis TaxID=1346319 RepID=A0ABZ0UUC1_9RICK|nr:trigger factor [Candidatus Trichorickettsia mobilis]WPY01201.1 Trigger factor [Candidatus Trichorickettsia mobilis]